eukprot:CAMPEP_0202753664 /NCGR_PEP_ID=MMETSP1388-20130828/13763_1 /ASSEMBLY_ACC=CAM_ASM_000864 /TAXON_ID=37098 /ORGANISM="Isochrysis sp, Strain CCMP1244" /LENGTH=92 /DNA_ID=CAMNT_0049421419 /DNA_START=102 /DNA_END=377 /DNA_ORIENTATION=+
MAQILAKREAAARGNSLTGSVRFAHAPTRSYQRGTRRSPQWSVPCRHPGIRGSLLPSPRQHGSNDWTAFPTGGNQQKARCTQTTGPPARAIA